MGRDKGNRTKGNVKPANSGRSAELLQSFGKEGLIPTTLLGTSNIVPALGMTSAITSLQPDESQLDTNLTILLRKLGKKDSTTKVKALGELNDLCTSDPEVCTQILKYWPNYYVKLARDEDRKVRELSHVVLQIIANNVGRNLATQIKNLYPVWFLSRSDTYSVVATKAETAFVNIFPTIEKQVQVTRFCCKEIFAFIRSERMFAGNELSKVTAIEGIIKLIQMGIGEDMPSGSRSGEAQGGQEQELEFDLDLDSDAFWNLGKDESALVRRSFYTLLTLMAEKKLEQLHPKKQRLNQIMKSSLTDEKLELDALWNCFLTLITKGFYPDKQFAQKQILICCKNAFYGNASILGPVLLPLVSKVGPFAGEELFIMLGRGYDLEKATNEGAAIMRTYAEILAYEFQTKNQVPAHAFPFIFQNLSAAHEFGRVIGNFWKASASATTFYDELVAFTFGYENIDKIQSSPALGHFVLSFLEPLKRKTTFRESGQYQPQQRKQSKTSGNENYDYETLDDVKKSFVRQMSLKLIEWKAWKPLSVISRNLASTGLFKDIQIDPQNIQFTEDSKIEGLKILLDLMKFQENFQGSDSGIFEKFFSGKDVSSFVKQIDSGEDYDSLPAVISYLKSESFLSNQHPSVTKYILKKGSTRFSPEVINGRISKLCETESLENLDLPLIQEIMNLRIGSASGQIADMSPLYSKIWQMFLDLLSQQTSIQAEEPEDTAELHLQTEIVHNPQAEKIENIAINILSNARLSKSELFDNICTSVPNCINSVGLNNLVEVSLKTVDSYEVKDRSSEFLIEPDLLVFTGFSKNPKLQDTLAPPFDSTKLQELLKRIYFESRLVVQLPEAQTEDQMIQLGLNLLWAHSAFELWREIEKFNWDWKSIDYCEGLVVELTRVLESLQSSQNLTAFWTAVQTKETGHLWRSKHPEKYLMETCLKMELPIPKRPDVIPTDFSAESGVDQVLSYLNHPEANIDGVNAALIKERNAFPDKFKFETLFSHVNPEGQRQLLAYLAVTLELLKREPNFATTAACWVAAWLRFGKTIGTGKLNYLWVQKLNEAVILIDSISKNNRESDFVQEYIEFHAKNIYPVIYSHFIQLTTENLEDESIWKEFCATKVCSAIAVVPKNILNSIEPDSSVLFQVFTPILLKKSPPFKLAAYHVLRRTRVCEKVIIPMELSGLLSRKVQDETKLDKVLTLLLGWDTLLKAQSETFELANFVKKDELLPKLLNILFFKLIPETTNLKPYFDTKPSLDPNTLPAIPHLSCYILQEVLRNLPYTVRWWWSLNLKQREKVHVEKLISKYLSAKLASEELGKVQWNESHDDDPENRGSGGNANPGENNVTVNLHPGCNELIAKYKIEETNVILKITLPLNHPLGQVIVHISDRKLHTKITQLLNTRSHSLASGLRLWKENLDNIYKDVDECAICFFILHHVTKALPKLGCSQCRKKFHAACLYKWFQTSNKSECPLCRNLF